MKITPYDTGNSYDGSSDCQARIAFKAWQILILDCLTGQKLAPIMPALE